MPNPLFNQFNNNEISNIIQQAKNFKNSFKGDPKEEVQKLLNSGQMTQEQFNYYSRMAQQIVGAMK